MKQSTSEWPVAISCTPTVGTSGFQWSVRGSASVGIGTFHRYSHVSASRRQLRPLQPTARQLPRTAPDRPPATSVPASLSITFGLSIVPPTKMPRSWPCDQQYSPARRSRLEILGFARDAVQQDQQGDGVVAPLPCRVVDLARVLMPRAGKRSVGLLLREQPVGKLPAPGQPCRMIAARTLLAFVGQQKSFHVIAKGAQEHLLVARVAQGRDCLATVDQKPSPCGGAMLSCRKESTTARCRIAKPLAAQERVAIGLVQQGDRGIEIRPAEPENGFAIDLAAILRIDEIRQAAAAAGGQDLSGQHVGQAAANCLDILTSDLRRKTLPSPAPTVPPPL